MTNPNIKIATKRALECRMHSVVYWYCDCFDNHDFVTGNRTERLRCPRCNSWMEWSYEQKICS